MNFRKTKIVATIGPSSEDKETLSKMVDEGVNVMRLNFSHGDFKEHQKKVDKWKEIAKEKDNYLGLLQDLSGPKIRIGEFKTEEVTLKKGEEFILTTEKIKGTKNKVYINYPHLPEDISVGDDLLIDDGKLRVKVTEVNEPEVITEVVIGGTIKGRRGVNLPGVNLQTSALTEKDKKDLEFGAKNDVDFVALSFVRTAEDIRELKKLMNKADLDAQIISKIETQQALDNIDEIIEETDGIMVARGDLAIEIGPEHVPSVQKMLIRRCNNAGKPVITATQMLESMIENKVPTRAEVSDIANAILDGTDAIMLSGETTVGDNPVEVVKVMSRVALDVEKFFLDKEIGKNVRLDHIGVVDSVTKSAIHTAKDVDNVSALIALTKSGFSARMLSRFKPKLKVIALSPHQKTCNQLSLSSGCQPIKVDKFESFDNVMDLVRKICLDKNLAKENDKIVVVAGIPFSGERLENAETNMMLVEEI